MTFKTEDKWMVRRLAALLVFAFLGVSAPALAGGMFTKKKDGSYQIDTSVHFPTGAKRFWQGHKKRMRQIAKFLKSHPEIKTITIIGHTDSRGPEEVNEKLSGARARFVKKSLVKLGVEPERLVLEMVGAATPKASNKSKLGRGKNRRVEFVVGGTAPAAEREPVVEEPVEEEEVAEAEVAEEEVAEEEVPAEEEEVAAAEEEEVPPEEEPEAEPEEELPAEEPVPEPVIEEVIPEPPPSFELLSWNTFHEYKHWIAAGATGLTTTIAIALGASASSKAAALDDLFVGNEDHTDAQNSARQLGVAADVFYTLSALGAVGTSWLFYDLYYGATGEAPETSVSVMPTAGGAMLQLQMPLGGD